jgi:hypothetical protein
MKSEVYSWRLSPELKADLERAARKRKIRVSDVLDLAAREWLAKNARDLADDEEQKRLHALVKRYIGVVATGNPQRAATAAATMRKNLRRQYGR